jgi:Na+/melibiose symporter-like transporter
MKHDRVYFINFLARFFGVAATFAGVVFLVAAYAIVEK